jgi:hypothetical protein
LRSLARGEQGFQRQGRPDWFISSSLRRGSHCVVGSGSEHQQDGSCPLRKEEKQFERQLDCRDLLKDTSTQGTELNGKYRRFHPVVSVNQPAAGSLAPVTTSQGPALSPNHLRSLRPTHFAKTVKNGNAPSLLRCEICEKSLARI